MKFNDLLQGTITRFDAKGRGLFDVVRPNAPTRPMAVPFTTIGDEVEVRFIKRDGRVFVGDLARVIKAGPDRIPPPTPGLDGFSGALWLPIAYDAQLRFKRELINSALEEAGHEERITAVIPSPVTTFYRNRMDYVFGWKGELGLKEFGSWSRYLDIKEDILLTPDAPKILDVFRELMKISDLKPWDNQSHDGDLRYVVIRDGKTSGDRLIALIVKDASRVDDKAKKFLLDGLDALATSIVIGENPTITDLSVATTVVPIKGDASLTEIVNGTKYRIHLNSFFQTNSITSGTLQDVVAEFVGKPSSLLDLYCGLGFFAINLAQRNSAMNVAGFEINAEAIELAKENAQTNSVADRCAFTSGPAEDLSWKDIEADAVIIDPPRAGLHPRVLKTLIEKRYKTLIYVSCNFHRLVEELKQLKGAYRIEEIRAVDMFPQTPHVEVVVKMTRSE